MYLNKSLDPAEKKAESVPYYSHIPESKGIMFDICDRRTLVYLDFETTALCVIPDAEDVPLGGNLYGYSVDYRVKGDYDLLGGIIDIAGGIELETEEEILRFTGIQIANKLSRESYNKEQSKEIINGIFKNLSQIGFQNSDFLYIIENSETNLTIPDCYYWSEYIKKLCSNLQIID